MRARATSSHSYFQKKKEIATMALIAVQGRFSKSPVAANSKTNKACAAASLAENSKKNATTACAT
jgi:hypothetical protein